VEKEGESAMNVFLELLKVKPDLQKMETKDLGKIRFAGPTAVSFMGRYIKRLEQKGLGEQREEALKDGEDIAEIIILNEAEIGRRYDALPQEVVAGETGSRTREAVNIKTKEKFRDELKISDHEAQRATAIAKHPDVVKEVLTAAKKEKELPTRERIHRTIREKAEAARPKEKSKSKLVMTLEQQIYINALERMIHQKIPTDWNDETFIYAKGLVNILIKRLEIFNGNENKRSTERVLPE
jgi:hypothetical protein